MWTCSNSMGWDISSTVLIHRESEVGCEKRILQISWEIIFGMEKIKGKGLEWKVKHLNLASSQLCYTPLGSWMGGIYKGSSSSRNFLVSEVFYNQSQDTLYTDEMLQQLAVCR